LMDERMDAVESIRVLPQREELPKSARLLVITCRIEK
jgi:hypothetical protein